MSLNVTQSKRSVISRFRTGLPNNND
uniref:Uncharacterized protein n=1 Tax=Nelumbo nucifera TaxID=4432 RepID=A0A822ZLI1_NELNU|nr:TPA_asm: hypothetical protein HUJ06_002621 [Nelumbo nucifera]